MKVSVLIMGRRSITNNNANTRNAVQYGDSATAHIKGIVSDFYGDGKKYDYITIDVRHDYDNYYDRVRVAVNKNYEVPDDGEPIEIDCNIRSYKGEILFKEIHADNVSNN